MSPSQDTFLSRVLAICEKSPDQLFLRHLTRAGKEEVTYQKLLNEASRYAEYFQSQGVSRGSVVVMVVHSGVEVAYAFLGAVLLGAIPSVFAYPSVKVPSRTYYENLLKLLENCRTHFLLTDVLLEENSMGPLRMTSAECKKFSPNLKHLMFTASNDDLLLLQHSSGTTGLKKGVALSHQSVINQLDHYAEAISLTPQDKIVSWLPLYHDMGLIAGFLLPMGMGIPLTLMSPFDWIASPALLLQAITEHRATLTWLPNFAYAFMAARISGDLSRYDLSSMRAFINCSEPITAKSHSDFLDKFSACGVTADKLWTCYAMAENTFAVTQGRGQVKGLEKDGRTYVSSGKALSQNEIRIENGEILIRSDSLMSGYYLRPDLTEGVLKDGWYYTGDLGFIDGEDLFVTARKKDVIIVAGKNIYPHDIEEVLSTVPGIQPGRVVAFGIANEKSGTEEITVLAELQPGASEAPLALKLKSLQKLKETLDYAVKEIVLLPPRWLEKSTSGKISRSKNKEKYMKQTELRAKLEERVKDFLCDRTSMIKKSQMDGDTKIFSSGLLDSMGLLELISFLENEFSVKLPEQTMLALDSINQIAEQLEQANA